MHIYRVRLRWMMLLLGFIGTACHLNALVQQDELPQLDTDRIRRHRLIFSRNGHAYIPIRITDGITSIHVEWDRPTEVLIQADGQTQSTATHLQKISAEVSQLNTPKQMEWIILKDYLYRDRSVLEQDIIKWKSKGLTLHVERIGSLYALGENARIDNRGYRLLAQPTSAVLGGDAPLQNNLQVDGRLWVASEASRTHFQVTGMGHSVDATFIHIHPQSSESTFKVLENGRRYRGELVIMPDGNGLMAVVNVISIDDLVAGILPAEIFPSAPLEAQKALAVAARGALLSKIGRRHLNDPYLLCSEVHCQAYKGIDKETALSRQAASETSGELLFVGERLVDTVYSASCGGHTARADHVWPKHPYPELMGRLDMPNVEAKDHKEEPLTKLRLSNETQLRAFIDEHPQDGFCIQSGFPGAKKVHRWTRTFNQAKLLKIFSEDGIGTILDIQVLERGDGGRLKRIRVIGTEGAIELDRELAIRRQFNGLRSGFAYFDLDRNEDGELVKLQIHGAGFGHGAGLCQHGSIGMSRAGFGYREILQHYYPGSEIGAIKGNILD